jgi:hypothetical protein
MAYSSSVEDDVSRSHPSLVFLRVLTQSIIFSGYFMFEKTKKNFIIPFPSKTKEVAKT